jgi:hypothetical protein
MSMARGKQRRASARRRAQADADALAVVRTELQAEQALLAAAKLEEAQLRERSELVARLRTELTTSTGPEVSYLRGQIDVLRSAVRAERAHHKRVKEHWEPMSDRLVDYFGGGLGAFELLVELLGGQRRTITSDAFSRAMTPARVQQLQYMRGERRSLEKPDIADLHRHPLDGLAIPAIQRQIDEQQSAEDTAPLTIAGVTDVPWTATTERALVTWHPMPWLTDSLLRQASPVATALGVTPSAELTDHPSPGVSAPATHTDLSRPVPAWSHTVRGAIAGMDPGEVLPMWQRLLASDLRLPRIRTIAQPLAPYPPQPSPTIAVALRSWYLRAGLGEWLRARDLGDPRQREFGLVTTGLAAAAPFWLPAAQAADFLDSEPLTEFEDLRLPFPQVFLTFAEPPDIPPSRKEGPEAERLGVIEAALLSERRHLDDHLPAALLQAAKIQAFDGPLGVSVAEAIEVRGARLEGVLLLGDALGRLSDQMAWALAVPTVRGGVLARVLVPAQWPHSRWRDQLLNAAAVTAWADWHAPGEASEASDRDVSAAPHGGGAGRPDDVYVLAVRSTRAQQHRAERTGRTMRAHLRRGHWRRQHHGPQGELVKRVRIAPTVVNAQRSDLGTRVYRLPGE